MFPTPEHHLGRTAQARRSTHHQEARPEHGPPPVNWRRRPRDGATQEVQHGQPQRLRHRCATVHEVVIHVLHQQQPRVPTFIR